MMNKSINEQKLVEVKRQKPKIVIFNYFPTHLLMFFHVMGGLNCYKMNWVLLTQTLIFAYSLQ